MRKKVAFVRDVGAPIGNLQHWIWGTGGCGTCTRVLRRLLYFANTGIEFQRGRARVRPPRPRCPTPHRPRLRRPVFIVLLVFVILAVAIVALGSQLRPRRPMQRERESTLKSRSNQIATCLSAHRLRFLFWHKTSQEVVHDSFPSTEIVAADGATFLRTRAGSRPRLAAKEMWKLHRADRRGRDIQPVCFSAFK